MKLQQTPKFNLDRRQNTAPANKNQVAFKGAETAFIQALRFLDTNQAWGACAVDVGCMGIPRTTVDFTRGPEAGLETARREFSSTGNHALIGIYGTLAAMALASGLNSKYGIKANKMFIANDTLDILAHHWNSAKAKSPNAPLKDYLENVFSSIKGFNPYETSTVKDEKGWVTIDKAAANTSAKKMLEILEKEPEKLSRESAEYLKSVIGTSVGAEGKLKLTAAGKDLESVCSLDTLIDNIYKVSKAFKSGKVAETFNGKLADNAFLKDLKGLNKKVSIAAMAAAIGLGLCIQPFNAYLTKLKTGKDGFVGVEGREPDKSSGFKLLKVAAAGIFGFGAISTIGGIGSLEKFLGKIQFKGLTPTIPQFKLIYGMTIMSRFMAARDKNELRESSIKDTLGFVSWLIFGGFVSKLTAAAFERMPMFKNVGEKFIRYNKIENGEHWFKWLTESNIMTRDEVLLEALRKAGKSAIKTDGKTAMTFKEMFEEVAKVDKMAIKKVRYLGLVQFAGYLYSGLALGVGIPKLNIAITKHFETKRKAKEQQVKSEPKTETDKK